MADLLDSDFALAEKNTLYRCLDRLVEHKDELFKFLKRRWGELFGAKFDVLLYDLTSTYFESRRRARPRGPAPVRLQPRQAQRLPPGRHRLDRHARGLPAELRGARGQHCGLDDLERVPRSHRAALRACQPHLGDGPRHPHRRRASPRCEPWARRTWWVRPRAGSPGSSRPSAASPGRACARACRSSGWPPRRTCTCSRKATRASTRSAACDASGCAVTSIGCRRCRAKCSHAISC